MGRPGLNRTAVIAAAADLADELGFDAVTISVLARHLGVRSPTLYSHISGATDLRTAVTAYVLDELADATSTAIAAGEGRDLLVAYADAIRDFARRSPGRYDATTRQRVPPASDPAAEIPDSVAAAITAGRRNADLALAVVRSYGIAQTDETYAVRLMSSLIHGYITLELAGTFAHSEPSSDATWGEALDDLDGSLTRLAARAAAANMVR
ncbi:TetR-like C-terminal domain-containing protein [Nocardioides albus]|uniref:AcrR family transcriptional regulator n=1 Tax=Nocardioides albus TaxID=1841 RepID=A0A7W5A583_9ACTN|nr:TetR-like C-terminal domain-containing protein [Nocardioides albus]MBB3089897.1 AcrR family transcriptional regulator [Nocardioides albus]GGU36421.1 TetR family transcriptional regulator [Nocardioides albus]